MALKRKLTQDEFDKLPKELQGEYVEKDGDYFLSIEGDDDPDALRRARDREKEEARRLRKENKEMKAKLDDIEGDDNRKKGDIDRLDASWKDKLSKEQSERKAEREALQGRIRKQMIESTSMGMAAEISTKPSLMRREIADRLRVEFDDDGEPSLVVLGSDGKPGSSLDALRKEILANKEYADILVASKGKGGGASNSPATPSGGAGGQHSTEDVDLLDPRNRSTLMERVKARVSSAS